MWLQYHGVEGFEGDNGSIVIDWPAEQGGSNNRGRNCGIYGCADRGVVAVGETMAVAAAVEEMQAVAALVAAMMRVIICGQNSRLSEWRLGRNRRCQR